jgi:hypothetical protein
VVVEGTLKGIPIPVDALQKLISERQASAS